MFFATVIIYLTSYYLWPVESAIWLYEGDILVRQPDNPEDALFSLANKWEGGEVVYRYGSKFTNTERRLLRKAMNTLKENTCLNFREAEDKEGDFVNIVKSEKEMCASYIGRRARPDRDQYITVHPENMPPGTSNQLRKRVQLELTQLNEPYGYHSLMQKTSNEDSIVNCFAKKPGIVLGAPEDKVRDVDLIRINRLYHCEEGKSTGSDQKWQKGEDGVSWALYCDFAGYDISKVQVLGEDCGGQCMSNPQCTHFTWSQIDGGTCFLKGDVPNGTTPWCLNEKDWPGAVCGFTGLPSKYELSEMVSCRVYEEE